MSFTYGRLSGVHASITLTLRVRPPRVVGVALRFPVSVPRESSVFVGEMVVNACVVLIVDASGGVRAYEVVHQGIRIGAFRGWVGHRKEFERARVKPIRADDVLHSIALNYRIAWQAMVVDVAILTNRGSCCRHGSKIAA